MVGLDHSLCIISIRWRECILEERVEELSAKKVNQVTSEYVDHFEWVWPLSTPLTPPW